MSNVSRLKKSYINYPILIFTFFMLIAENGFSQARSGVGVRFGINKPYADAYKFGSGAAFQFNSAFDRKWGAELSIGYDKINGDRETLYYPEEAIKMHPELYPLPSRTFIEAESLNLFHIDLAAKYYITPDLFAKLGPVFYIAGGNEDLVAGGIGGTAAVGYQLMMDNRNKLEFVFNTDLIDSRNGRGNGVIPIAGLKVAYSFNFRRI
jgi:hypothetical protein